MKNNRTKFDSAAKDWDKNQYRIKMANNIVGHIINNIPLTQEHTVMDFGCGTGLIGLNIAHLVQNLIGADLSINMLDTFKNKAAELGFNNTQTLHLDENTDFNELKFDAIVSAMTIHHIKEPNTLFNKFASSLKSGAYLGIADLAKEDGSFHDDNTGVYHFGFEQKEFEELFIKNGFELPQILVAHTVEKPHGSYDIYFCYARKI